MRTAQQRIAKYNARMLSTLVDPTLAAVNVQQMQSFEDYELEFYPKQLQLRTILNAVGIPTAKYAGFEAFHGELYHLYKVSAGASLLASAVILVTKWSSDSFLGAGNASVLKDIALTIYGLIIP